MQICRQVQKLLINQSGYRRVPFWEIGLRKFVSHTTVIQQLQFKMPETVIKHHIWPLKSIGFEQNNAWSTQFWWKPKINIFYMQIENHCILYCDWVSVRLISGVRVAFNARGGAVLSSSRLRVQSFQKSVCLFLSLGWDIVCLHIPLFWEKKRLLFVLHVILQSQLNISWLSMLICLRQERNIFKKDLCIHPAVGSCGRRN